MDGIDARDLLRAIWASRLLILLIIILCTGIAAAYAFFTTPTFRTSVHMLPPTVGNLASYNIASQLTGESVLGTVGEGAEGIEPLKPQDVYRIFLRHLNSNAIRQNFFETFYLPSQTEKLTESVIEDAWERLNRELKIVLPKGPDGIDASLILEGQNPISIADWANAYVELANEATRQEIISMLAGEVTIRDHSLRQQISALRAAGEKERLDRIARLESALAIAESIGLEGPIDGAPLIAINIQRDSEDMNSDSLVYLRGTKALQAELNILKRRNNDDAYIPQLSSLLKKQALLKSIDLDLSSLSVVSIDRPASAPTEPIKPEKGLIVCLGFILGIILAPLLVFFRLIFYGLQPRV